MTRHSIGRMVAGIAATLVMAAGIVYAHKETPRVSDQESGIRDQAAGTGPQASKPKPVPPGTGPNAPGTKPQAPGTGTHPPGTGPAPPGTGLLPPGTGPEPPGTGLNPPGTVPAPPGAGALASGIGPQVGPANTLTAAERKAGWRLLFDGKTTTGWRVFKKDAMGEGWKAVDGALTRVGEGGDIITTEQFDDFELMIDWMIGEGGNSGVFFNATETVEPIYTAAPEMQVLDNARHKDGKVPELSAGSNYALHPPVKDVTNPVGSWNTARLIVRGNHVEHWLNGVKLLEYELGSADWQARVSKSKFKEWPPYGKEAKGHIGLQDHGNRVAFRNIKIRPLPSK